MSVTPARWDAEIKRKSAGAEVSALPVRASEAGQDEQIRLSSSAGSCRGLAVRLSFRQIHWSSAFIFARPHRWPAFETSAEDRAVGGSSFRACRVPWRASASTSHALASSRKPRALPSPATGARPDRRSLGARSPRKRPASFHVAFQSRDDAIKRICASFRFGLAFGQRLGDEGKRTSHQPFSWRSSM